MNHAVRAARASAGAPTGASVGASTSSRSLHDEHAAATRRRILEATAALIVEEHPATLSIPSVAARAGVSVRTVYRHFPTKEALLDALASTGDEQTRAAMPDAPMSLDTLREVLPPLWRELMGTRALTIAQYATPLGHELRVTRARRRRTVIKQALDAQGIELDADDRQRLEAIISVLVNRTTLFEMTDVLGLTPEEAAAIVAWTTEVVVEAARRTRRVGE